MTQKTKYMPQDLKDGVEDVRIANHGIRACIRLMTEDRINNGFFVVDMSGFSPSNPSAYQMVDIPASYHNGAAGVAFADGHSEIHRWQDPRTTPPVRKGRNLPLTAAARNNQDVGWLQERSTGLRAGR